VTTRVNKTTRDKEKEMASIKVKGTVSRVFYEGKGLEVSEQFQTKAGESITKRYTVWLKQAGTYDVGDELQVEGLYSAEIDNWTNKEGEAKQSIKVSINNPYITPADPAQLVKSLFEPTHEPTPF
jgi:hypothetical protein